MAELFNVSGIPDFERTQEFFKVTDAESTFNAIGKIIRLSQEWERTYKDFCIERNADINDLETSCLNKINRELKKEKNGIISEEIRDNLRKIIDIRNYINHEFFLKSFNGNYELINEQLNDAYFLIGEATDYVDNLRDAHNGERALRPTIWDKEDEEEVVL